MITTCHPGSTGHPDGQPCERRANITSHRQRPGHHQLINALLPQLNAGSMAAYRQHQLELDWRRYLGHNRRLVNNLIADLTPWITGAIMPTLDENAIAAIANDPATVDFLNRLILLLDETICGYIQCELGMDRDFILSDRFSRR